MFRKIASSEKSPGSGRTVGRRVWVPAVVAGLLVLGLGCGPVRGQQGSSDWLGWGVAGVRVQPDSGRWALDVIPVTK